MGDCVSDYYASIGLVVDEHRALERLNPDHELLALAEIVPGGFKPTKDWLKKYEPDGGRPIIGNSAYWKDLHDAVTAELQAILASERRKLTGTLTEVNAALEEKFTAEGLIGLFRIHITHNKRPLVLA